MRVGLFGSAILLMLTIIFSYIAIQNNKLARQVAIKQFGLDKNNSSFISKENNQTQNITQTETDNFDKQFSDKLKEFDKKFNSF